MEQKVAVIGTGQTVFRSVDRERTYAEQAQAAAKGALDDAGLTRMTCVLMQMDMWSMGLLRPTKVKDMAKTGDAEKKLIVAEYTLIGRNPNSSAKLQGFYPGA